MQTYLNALRVKPHKAVIDEINVTFILSDDVMGFLDKSSDVMYEFKRSDIEAMLARKDGELWD